MTYCECYLSNYKILTGLHHCTSHPDCMHCSLSPSDTKVSKEGKEASATSTSDTESTQIPGCVDRNNKRASNILGKLQSGLRRNKSNENKAPKPDAKPDNNKPDGLPDSPGLVKISDEVVYAELDLAPGEKKTSLTDGEKKFLNEEGTEYAQIVGIINNQDQSGKH